MEQQYCEREDCVYWEEDEIHLGEKQNPYTNCKHPNIKMQDPNRPCAYYRLDWSKQKK